MGRFSVTVAYSSRTTHTEHANYTHKGTPLKMKLILLCQQKYRETTTAIHSTEKASAKDSRLTV